MMKTTPDTLFDRGMEAARRSILEAVRTRYFPELWYVLESWFLLLRRKRALVIGHGFGMIAEALAKSGWDVTVADPSLAALTEMKARFDKSRLNGAFEQAEPDALPFAAGSFDAVASINMLELARDPYQAAHEMGRVLVPGGRAVVATFNKHGPWGLATVVRATRPAEDKRPARFLTKAALVRLLKATDLKLEDVKLRAQYLPLGPKAPKLPLAGALIALLVKSDVTPNTKGMESSVRPRSRPSMSRRPKANG